MSGGVSVVNTTTLALQATLLQVQTSLSLGFQQPTTVEVPTALQFNSGVSSAFSAWTQLIASTAAAMRHMNFTGGLLSAAVLSGDFVIEIGQGAGGAEVIIGRYAAKPNEASAAGILHWSWSMDLFKTVAAGQRLAVRASYQGATAILVNVGASLEEA